MIKTLYKTFQRWSEKGSIYILSDLHLGDDDCKYMDKNWISPDEQIKLINDIAHKNDTFICLGDVGDPNYARKIKAGYKVLILGNHDRRKDYEDIFDEIYEGALFVADRILLSHEPVYGLSWCMNIHGHNHNGGSNIDNTHLNLAANVCGYTPVSLAKLIKTGFLSDIKSIHRQTIDNQIKRKDGGLKEKLSENDLEIQNEQDVADNEKETYRITEWGCLYLCLTDYGIDVSKIPGRVGKHIVEDFMDSMCKAGYISVANEN